MKKHLFRGILCCLLLVLAVQVPGLALALGEPSADGRAAALPNGAYDGEWDGAYTYLLQQLLAGEEEIDITEYGLTYEEAFDIYSKLYYSEAELFFLTGNLNIAYEERDGVRCAKRIKPVYDERETIAERLADFRLRAGEIADAVPAGLGELKTVAYIHDYIALHFTYDDNFENYDAYSFLLEGTGVCQSYALLARYLLRQLGIAAECVVSDGLRHEWNLVMIGGEWYHMDITWDDRNDDGLLGQVDHRYFLGSDSDFRDGRHFHTDGWEAPAEADDTRYDRLFYEATSTFVFDDAGELYFVMESAIMTYSEQSGRFTVLYTISDRWHTYGRPNEVWQGCYAGLAYLRGMLFFNTEGALWSFDLATKRAERIGTRGTAVAGYFFGMELDGGTARFGVKSDPNTAEYTTAEYEIGCTVTWEVLDKTYEEYYFFGETPLFKGKKEIPIDQYLYTVTGWDAEPTPVTGSATYRARVECRQIYESSCLAFLAAVDALDSAVGMREMRARIEAAEVLRHAVNPMYEGYDAACARLDAARAEYDAEAVRSTGAFSGWIPSEALGRAGI